MEKWNETLLAPEFSEQGVDCYRLVGGDYENEYYVVSETETRKLLNKPEVVGYEVYHCLIPATAQMMYYFKEQKKVTTANILSILRGALNYPLEESCYREHIRVHDISFLSSERVFNHDEIAGLEIKYSKLTMVPDSTLLIGDIIATGDTLLHCLGYVIEFYRKNGAKLRNIIIFTIGGTRGIELLEQLTKDIRKFWPDFEGFILVYYEGIFTVYQDKGVSGINLPDIDFYWKNGIVAPEFRRETLSKRDPLFEKCIIYDGGARRYEIHEHVREVLGFWEGILARADQIDFKQLLDEKLGYPAPVSYEEWLHYNHYEKLDAVKTTWLYRQEQGYIESLKGVTLQEIAVQRIHEFKTALRKYIL
ncbi:MAG: hypothetical protein LUC99_03105 [Clostridiales bacterium]|nr:hypothetical protein [Clostridiales bacterium]